MLLLTASNDCHMVMLTMSHDIVDNMAASAGRRHKTLDEEVLSQSEKEYNPIDANESSDKHMDFSPDTSMMIRKMYEGFEGMRADIKEMTSKVNFTMDEITACKKDCEALKRKSESMSTDLITAKNEIVALKCENETLKNRLIQQDSYTRRSNLIIYGVPHKPDEVSSRVVKSIFKETLEIENAEAIRFERCHRLPVPVNPKPIIVRFNWFEDRTKVWACRTKLKGTNLSLREDFPAEIVERRNTLYPVLKKAKELNKSAYMVMDKLNIDGTVYTVSNLHTLPPSLDPAALATKKVGNTTAFFSKMSPLSNFHDSVINIDDKIFKNVEQYFQYQKAIFAVKPEIARKIKDSKSPAMCKKFGDEIKLDETTWLPVAKETLARGCVAKFRQNVHARNFLFATGETVLAEASKDKYWGIGLPLSAITAENSNPPWDGSNVFGNILMDVRTRLKKEFSV